jgi:hypothetical protein
MDPADMSGGTGGPVPKYPEQWKRERMLWFVHEWIQEHQTDENFVPELSVHDVQQWGDEQEGLNGAQAVNLFKQLYEEGYIYLNFLDTNIDRYPWFRTAPQSLSTRGLLEIGELPDPDERLAAALAATRRAIEQEPSIPEEEKRDMLDTLEKMASLANNVRGVAQAIIQGLAGG